jgi:hypothetical protein
VAYLGIFRCKMPWSCHFLLLCLALRHSKNKKRARIKHSRYRKDFFKSLSIEERRRRYRKIQKKREATSARQTAEWGMLALQASFPRLKDRFVYEERGERRIVLKMMVLLYNMRARMVGINQILNTYMPRLMWDANDVNF